MSKPLPVSRHAFFGDVQRPNRLYLVPETDVRFELERSPAGTTITAIFDGKRICLPPGTAVQFLQLEAITEQGGIGFADPVPDTLRNLPGMPRR